MRVQVQQRLQVKLANINVPHYITPLRLQSLDLGTTPPLLKSAFSLPSPEPYLMPRLVTHLAYSGRCTLVIQTNVDLKDSPGYVSFDKALEVFGTDAAAGSGDGAAALDAEPGSFSGSSDADAATRELLRLSGSLPEGMDAAAAGSANGAMLADTEPGAAAASAAAAVVVGDAVNSALQPAAQQQGAAGGAAGRTKAGRERLSSAMQNMRRGARRLREQDSNVSTHSGASSASQSSLAQGSMPRGAGAAGVPVPQAPAAQAQAQAQGQAQGGRQGVAARGFQSVKNMMSGGACLRSSGVGLGTLARRGCLLSVFARPRSSCARSPQ